MINDRRRVYNFGGKLLEASYWVDHARNFGSVAKITAAQPANFITPLGAWKKRKQIEKKGLPNFRNARFITLTVDHDMAEHNPEIAYNTGKRYLRQFMYELRILLGVTEEQCPHCWKLEFHANGWPHWHLIFLYRKKLPYELVDAAWRLGRTETQRISKNDFGYLFKYVTKGGADLPGYILNRKSVRFWQTSKHFHPRTTEMPQASPRQAPPKVALETEKRDKKKYLRRESTLGERVSRWLRTVSIAVGSRVAIVELASVARLIRRAAFQIAEELEYGFSTMVLTPISVTLRADLLRDFLRDDFSGPNVAAS